MVGADETTDWPSQMPHMRGGYPRTAMKPTTVAERKTGGHGFTLLELLVVIAIIGILAALLFPSFGRAKSKAQGVYCMNNGKQLALALHLYADDHSDWLPPNPEDRASTNHWVEGNFKHNPADATNTLLLTDPKFAKLAPYSGRSAAIYRCPADTSMVTIDGIKYPRVRTFSMSQAVGTKSSPPLAAVDGPWLDGKAEGTFNKHNEPWRTYGRFSDMIAPAPSGLWVLLDEEERSLNDAAFAVLMRVPTRFVDFPGTYHNLGCGFAFADGHSEIHKWVNSNTKLTGMFDGINYERPPITLNNADVLWLQARTSARAIPEETQAP